MPIGISNPNRGKAIGKEVQTARRERILGNFKECLEDSRIAGKTLEEVFETLSRENFETDYRKYDKDSTRKKRNLAEVYRALRRSIEQRSGIMNTKHFEKILNAHNATQQPGEIEKKYATLMKKPLPEGRREIFTS